MEKLKAWGSKYFLGKFNRLVEVKSMVDAANFYNKQIIPHIPLWGKKLSIKVKLLNSESHVYFMARGRPLEYLLDREPNQKIFLKTKSNFVKEPITKAGWEGIWKRFLNEVEIPVMVWKPFGARMNEISESKNPFPHRVGNIYNILYTIAWRDGKDSQRNLDSLRRLYKHMTPYVTKSPRASYLNYKDLDLGQYKNGEVMSYGKAKAWGSKYFLGNFNRLVKVKSMVDPDNFFNNKQSIPPVKAWGKKW